jgi:hypothetical protein
MQPYAASWTPDRGCTSLSEPSCTRSTLLSGQGRVIADQNMSGTPPGGASTNPFASANPFGPTSPVEQTYQPPAMTGAWGAQPQLEEDDVEPFTVAHLSAQDAVVPAIPVSSAAAPAHTSLTFTGAACDLGGCAGRDRCCQRRSSSHAAPLPLQRPAAHRVKSQGRSGRRRRSRAWALRPMPRCCWAASRAPPRHRPWRPRSHRRTTQNTPSTTSSATERTSTWTRRCAGPG